MNELACFEQDAVSFALKHPEYSSYFTLFCPSSAFHVCLCMRVCVVYLAFLAVWHMKSSPMSLFNGYCSFRLQVYKHMQTFIRSRAYMYLQGSVNISWTVCTTRVCAHFFAQMLSVLRVQFPFSTFKISGIQIIGGAAQEKSSDSFREVKHMRRAVAALAPLGVPHIIKLNFCTFPGIVLLTCFHVSLFNFPLRKSKPWLPPTALAGSSQCRSRRLLLAAHLPCKLHFPFAKQSLSITIPSHIFPPCFSNAFSAEPSQTYLSMRFSFTLCLSHPPSILKFFLSLL